MNKKEIIENGTLAIKNGKITFVGKSAAATSIKAEKEIDAKEKVAIPGLINCHTHLPMTLFRGIAEDQPLDVWLKETIWPLEAKLKPNDVYAGALLGCLEMIKNGTTCFADMYFYEDMVAKAVEKSGLRGVLAQGIIESGHKLLGAITLRKSISFAKKFHGYANGRVRTMLGPHAAYSCSLNLLKKIKKKSAELNIGVQIHLAESKAMFKEFEKKHGLSEVEFLDKIGFLNEKVLAAHCIDLSEKDMHILSERGVNVVHAPVANMKLGEGAAKVKDLMDLGVNVCLGTDGPASNNTLDMFESMKTAALLQKHTYRDPAVLPAYEVLKMATINGTKALGLTKEVGSIEVDKKADLILVDLSKPHLKPLHNIHASLVYAAHGSDADTVIVDGKILMENRQVKTLDEHAVIENAQKIALDLVS
ncbi:amidohydrolase [Candidatus Bathyarchaeota archaeon A05DMB-5]|jgi:5-methylthioadenosine/S-adenosylhomocysteine deaminase|nr:amidohydrolase [Candidatus Bathyarchaeota archaeon A05DMB-5]